MKRELQIALGLSVAALLAASASADRTSEELKSHPDGLTKSPPTVPEGEFDIAVQERTSHLSDGRDINVITTIMGEITKDADGDGVCRTIVHMEPEDPKDTTVYPDFTLPGETSPNPDGSCTLDKDFKLTQKYSPALRRERLPSTGQKAVRTGFVTGPNGELIQVNEYALGEVGTTDFATLYGRPQLPGQPGDGVCDTLGYIELANPEDASKYQPGPAYNSQRPAIDGMCPAPYGYHTVDQAAPPTAPKPDRSSDWHALNRAKALKVSMHRQASRRHF